MAGKTLYDKIWDAHLVDETPEGDALLFIDLHLIHEVTSPQAFQMLRERGTTAEGVRAAYDAAEPALGDAVH